MQLEICLIVYVAKVPLRTWVRPDMRLFVFKCAMEVQYSIACIVYIYLQRAFLIAYDIEYVLSYASGFELTIDNTNR